MKGNGPVSLQERCQGYPRIQKDVRTVSLCRLKFSDNQQFTGPEIAISRRRRLTLNLRHKRGLFYVARLLASMEGVWVVDGETVMPF